MGAQRFAKIVLATAATTYPFIGLVARLSALQADRLTPCNKHGCGIVKLFPDESSRSTVSLGGSPFWTNPFHMVQNGVGFAEPAPRGFLPARCPQKQESAMREFCAGPDATTHVVNPLTRSTSKLVYIWSVCGWFLFKVIHDVLLFGGATESTTLRIGIVSVLCQLVSVAAGFMWCMGPSEVFVAAFPHLGCACYYELPAEEVLLAIGTPSLLLVLVIRKLEALPRAVMHGDYLYFMQYDVPFHLVAQSVPDASGSLLVGTVSGAQMAMPRDRLPSEQLQSIQRQIWMLQCCMRLFVAPCVGVAVGPLAARLMALAATIVIQDGGPLQQTSFMLLFAAVLLLMGLFICHAAMSVDYRYVDAGRCRFGDVFLQWPLRAKVQNTGLTAYGLLLHVGGTIVLIAPLLGVAFGRDVQDNAHHRQMWGLAGILVFWFGVMSAASHWSRPSRVALLMKVAATIPPSEYIAVARRYPEFKLDDEANLAQHFLDSHPMPHGREGEGIDTWWSDWEAALHDRRLQVGSSGGWSEKSASSETSDGEP